MVIPRAMHKIVLVPFMSLVFAFFNSAPAFGATHPATVGQSPDSIAMQLHYPPKEKAAKTQGAVKFYCEVSPKVNRVTFPLLMVREMRGLERQCSMR